MVNAGNGAQICHPVRIRRGSGGVYQSHNWIMIYTGKVEMNKTISILLTFFKNKLQS